MSFGGCFLASFECSPRTAGIMSKTTIDTNRTAADIVLLMARPWSALGAALLHWDKYRDHDPQRQYPVDRESIYPLVAPGTPNANGVRSLKRRLIRGIYLEQSRRDV